MGSLEGNQNNIQTLIKDLQGKLEKLKNQAHQVPQKFRGWRYLVRSRHTVSKAAKESGGICRERLSPLDSKVSWRGLHRLG